MSQQQLNEELILFRDTVVAFIENEVAPYYDEWEQNKIVPKAVWRKLGENGLLGCDLPEQYGGYGVDFRFNMLVIEELSRAGFMTLGGNIAVHSDICCHYLLNMGTEAQKQKYLPKMASGDIIGAICMSEPGAGSDLQGMKTTAVKQGDTWKLNGSKTFISNGQNGSLYIVAARTDLTEKAAKGITLFLVDGDKKGFQRGKNLEKLGHHCGDTSELFFDDVELTDDDILGGLHQGFVGLMQELPRERLSLACAAVAHAEGALALAVEYVNERHAFGKPLANLQDIRFKLAEMYTMTETHRVLVEAYKLRIQEKTLSAVDASMAKLTCTEIEGKVVDMALQMFGGYGYMKEYPISRFYADARVQRIYGGTSEIMKEIISRQVVQPR